MPRFATIAEETDYDSWDEKVNPLVAIEVVEANDEAEALEKFEYARLEWHYRVWAYKVAPDTVLGEWDETPPPLVETE